MKKNLFTLIALFSLTGCATMMTQDQSAYLSKAAATPKELTIPKDKADEAWGRAQSFVGRYSDMKIQMASDYVLQTYNPGPGQIGFTATKTPAGNNVNITADAFTSYENPFIAASMSNRVYINANVFRYYIFTGEEPPAYLLTGNYSLDTSTAPTTTAVRSPHTK